MSDLRDVHGNPIPLTDEHGNPVQLTDEHGNPVYSEDDGMGGRRKKKGLKEKIKEKLTGGKHKTEAGEEGQSQTVTYVAKTRITTTSNATTPPPEQHYHHHDQHEKKSMMEKIKEKLPGHHSH
ncbi:hypothetical protein Gorai_008768 [Gossypium raimondii]|uniref:Dehydrin n=1 Tax=Gossypium raimondii TaxID=29730 RepID=A0A7J8PR54_GOSRA|nr:hypothetical protein [Gossypium raimondii]